MQPANVKLKEGGSIKLQRKKGLSANKLKKKKNPKKQTIQQKKGRGKQMRMKTIPANRCIKKNQQHPFLKGKLLFKNH